MSPSEASVKAVRYGSRYAAPGEPLAARSCPMCNTVLSNSRATFCSAACKQRAFRLRRQPPVPNASVLRQQLKRQGLLGAHTIYECPNCQERFVGERRCPACQVFCRAVGLGGLCPECDQPILLTDLLGTEVLGAP